MALAVKIDLVLVGRRVEEAAARRRAPPRPAVSTAAELGLCECGLPKTRSLSSAWWRAQLGLRVQAAARVVEIRVPGAVRAARSPWRAARRRASCRRTAGSAGGSPRAPPPSRPADTSVRRSGARPPRLASRPVSQRAPRRLPTRSARKWHAARCALPVPPASPPSSTGSSAGSSDRAALLGARAARVEAAARRDVHGARRVALEARLGRLADLAEPRRRLEQHARVGRPGVAEERVASADLGDAAEVHDGDPVREVAGRRRGCAR